MVAMFNDGIGVQIKNNESLAHILRTIIDRGTDNSKGMFGHDYSEAYRQITSSLETVIMLLEDQQETSKK